MAAERRQAGFQVAFLELGDRQLDPLERLADGPAHAQGKQRGDQQAGADQHQAGEQAAVAADQRALMRNLEFEPADQRGVVGTALVGQVEVVGQHRHQDARGVQPADPGQALGVGRRRGGDHARPGVGARLAVFVENRHGAHVGLIEHLADDALQALVVAQAHRRRRQRRQLLGDQFAALVELVAQLGQLHPGEEDAEHDCQQGARQQRQYQYTTTNSQVFEHGPSPKRGR